MQQLFLIMVLLVFAVFGYYMMRKLDGFLEENSKRQKEETKEEQ